MVLIIEPDNQNPLQSIQDWPEANNVPQTVVAEILHKLESYAIRDATFVFQPVEEGSDQITSSPENNEITLTSVLIPYRLELENPLNLLWHSFKHALTNALKYMTQLHDKEQENHLDTFERLWRDKALKRREKVTLEMDREQGKITLTDGRHDEEVKLP